MAQFEPHIRQALSKVTLVTNIISYVPQSIIGLIPFGILTRGRFIMLPSTDASEDPPSDRAV